LTLSILFLCALAVVLLLLLVWAIRSPRYSSPTDPDPNAPEDLGRRHVTYFPQVRQAVAAEDFVFLASRGSRQLTRRVQTERRAIALSYLACLRMDFFRLWRLSRVIARLSPHVVAGQEFERLRLGIRFTLRYEMVRLDFLFGLSPLPDLSSLSEMVSKLALRLETAMTELGERAALASELGSALHGRGVNTP
jgi:hypothetical protein